MTAILTSVLLPILLPLVTGYLTTGSMQWLKKISDTIDGLPSWLKPVIVFVISTAVTLAAKGLGWVISPSDLSMLGSTDIQAVLGGLVAIVLHHTSAVQAIQSTQAVQASQISNVQMAPAQAAVGLGSVSSAATK